MIEIIKVNSVKLGLSKSARIFKIFFLIVRSVCGSVEPK
jgi:hypothetical protein